MPVGEKALLEYLASGAIKGIGAATARRLLGRMARQWWKLLLVVILQWCTSPLSGHMLAQFEYRVNQNLEQHLELPDGEQEAGQ